MMTSIELTWTYKFDYKIFAYTQQFINDFDWRYNPTRLIVNRECISGFVSFLTKNGYEIPEGLLNINLDKKEKSRINTIRVKDYQLEDANRILKQKRLLLLSEPGTGKTLICIFAGSQIQGRKLVMAPKVLIHNWAFEINR